MNFSIAVDSRAYMHHGGTKYYRLISVSVVTLGPGGKIAHSLINNYGSFKPAAKGGLEGHRPADGGNSSIEHFDNGTSLSNKLNSEAIRRRGRGYDESMPDRTLINQTGLTLDQVETVLRDKVGITAGHWLEIQGQLGLKVEASTSPSMSEVLAKAKADIADKVPVSGRRTGKSSAARAAADAMAAAKPPAPERDRGPEWGSW